MLIHRGSGVDVEAMAALARRRAVLMVIREHPMWTLEQVLAASETHAELLSSLTIYELQGHVVGLPLLPRTRYEYATSVSGEAFDRLVLEVLREAEGAVKTQYLRARLGGPRWKVKGSLERLCAKGLVLRKGMTSNTCYRALSSEANDGQ